MGSCFIPEVEPEAPVEEIDPVVPQPPVIPGTPYIEGKIWWYHSDHLGSSSYLTDVNGLPTHYYGYLPFGEIMVEHNNSNYDNVYKFNGKELDESTGYYYYGARYYDPRLSIFISVDPLAEQFPNWNPYHYVHNNPINLIDPTGMYGERWEGGGFGDKKGDNWLSRAWNGFTSLFRSKPNTEVFVGPIEEQDLQESSQSNSFIKVWSDFTGGSQAVQIHEDAKEFSSYSDGSKDWAAYAGYSLMLEKATNPGALEIGRNLFARSPVVAKSIGSFFKGGRLAKASELVGYAEQQGWKAMRSSGGPLKYVDGNGIIRMTIKQGSQRAAGSGFPHVELRNALGKRTDVFGNEVTRKSIGNHTEIIFDLK